MDCSIAAHSCSPLSAGGPPSSLVVTTPLAEWLVPVCTAADCSVAEPGSNANQVVLVGYSKTHRFCFLHDLQTTLCRYSVVQPVEGHSKLTVDEEGLAVISQIEGPVIPVVVIGPYRSGKSFVLNQVLGVGCGKYSST